MEEVDIETHIHNLITTPTHREQIFVLINPYEIDILETNRIAIKGFKIHYYCSWDLYKSRSHIIEKYKTKYPADTTDVYLLGKGPVEEYELRKDHDNVRVFLSFNSASHRPSDCVTPNTSNAQDSLRLPCALFNSLKYISKFPEEIVVGERAEPIDNQVFIDSLRTNYANSLFYCPYNTGILGIEGYTQFCTKFYQYMSTVDTIYLVNVGKPMVSPTTPSFGDDSFIAKGGFTGTVGSNTVMDWILKSGEHANKVKYLEVDVGKLYQTNPELIAYYRIQLDHYVYNNYLDVYYKFADNISQIEDQIYIGTNFYKQGKLPETITHILNVSDDPMCESQIPENTIYEHYPIVECSTKHDMNRAALLAAAERIHELISSGAIVYVHCSLGVNRSPAAVLMYFVKYRGMTLFDAYVALAQKRRIFTSIELFDILREECDGDSGAGMGGSPLKLRTNYAGNFCYSNVALFALYDVLQLREIFSV